MSRVPARKGSESMLLHVLRANSLMFVHTCREVHWSDLYSQRLEEACSVCCHAPHMRILSSGLNCSLRQTFLCMVQLLYFCLCMILRSEAEHVRLYDVLVQYT